MIERRKWYYDKYIMTMEMEKELIYHIGTFKTGSTSLQTFLANNREELLKAGIFYPECLYEEGRPEYTNGNAYPLNDPEMDSDNYKHGIENLKKYFSEYDKILISSEDFWSSNTKQERLRELKELGVIVKIIVYLRRQDDYLDSLCNQLIKTGLLSFEKGQSHIYELGLYTDYYKELTDIKNVIGKENIFVRVFEKEQLYNENIFDDFLHVLNIDKTEAFVKPEKRLNRSLSNKHREFINICNNTLENSYRGIDCFMYKKNTELSERYLTQKGKKEQSNFFSEQERKHIVEKYQNGNECIAKEYLQREDGILFSSVYPEDDESESSEIEIEDVIRWVALLIHEHSSRIYQNRINLETRIANLKEKLEKEKERNDEFQQLADAIKNGYSLRKIRKMFKEKQQE